MNEPCRMRCNFQHEESRPEVVRVPDDTVVCLKTNVLLFSHERDMIITSMLLVKKENNREKRCTFRVQLT
jgi:hypothetical protein